VLIGEAFWDFNVDGGSDQYGWIVKQVMAALVQSGCKGSQDSDPVDEDTGNTLLHQLLGKGRGRPLMQSI